MARHDFAVVVKDQQVWIEDLGPSLGNRSRASADFKVQPATVEPGDPVVVSIKLGATPCQGMQLTTPYCRAASETLPGFRYDKTTTQEENSMHYAEQTPTHRQAGLLGLVQRPR